MFFSKAKKPANIMSPQSEGKIAAMFDRIAPEYDFLNRVLSAGQDKRWRKTLISFSRGNSGGTYLDMATGTGDVLSAFVERWPEYSEYIGADISDNMINLAKEKCKNLPSTRFMKMSAENIGVGDASVDTLTIAFGLRNVVDKPQALKEFSRVLKPGGELLILEFFLPRSGLTAQLFQLYFHKLLPRIAGLFSDRDAYTYLPRSVGSFYTEIELFEKLAALKMIKVKKRSFLFGAVRCLAFKKEV